MCRSRTAIAVVIACVGVIALSLSAVAQSELRIVRPVDGATVRETVSILVPVSSVPMNPDPGFIACSIDGVYAAASAEKSDDGRYFVWRWDTKAVQYSPETGQPKGRPKEGKHTIVLQAYSPEKNSGSGKKFGNPAQITVYVKNSASADMPAGGLKLRYNDTVGSVNDYKFRYVENLKSIEGATNFTRALGEAIEGAEGVVRRSIEDVIDRGSYLVRQKLQGTLQLYFAGRAIPADIAPKSEYHVEDSLGHTTYVMSSSSPGMPIGVDLPILPSQSVKIGDTWSEPMKLFKCALTGESAKLMSTSTLEGLEWEGGYPCAKITTKFGGDVRVPSSTLLTKPLSLTGEATTYFAYRIGKVVSFTVKAYAQPELDQKDVEGLKQTLITSKSMPNSPYAAAMPEENITGRPQAGTESYGPSLPNVGSSRGSSGRTVKVKVEFVQSLWLVD
ncbi:MAG: hypothetical protein NTU88_06760 [Armatimonadetes bacterium]|nr:hypothetical protein [Armatimonadota bacterium]